MASSKFSSCFDLCYELINPVKVKKMLAGHTQADIIYQAIVIQELCNQFLWISKHAEYTHEIRYPTKFGRLQIFPERLYTTWHRFCGLCHMDIYTNLAKSSFWTHLLFPKLSQYMSEGKVLGQKTPKSRVFSTLTWPMHHRHTDDQDTWGSQPTLPPMLSVVNKKGGFAMNTKFIQKNSSSQWEHPEYTAAGCLPTYLVMGAEFAGKLNTRCYTKCQLSFHTTLNSFPATFLVLILLWLHHMVVQRWYMLGHKPGSKTVWWIRAGIIPLLYSYRNFKSISDCPCKLWPFSAS